VSRPVSFVPIIDGAFRWDRWAAPKTNGPFDHHAARIGDDLVRFVYGEHFP
jgi:type I restriction enzyme M protein